MEFQTMLLLLVSYVSLTETCSLIKTLIPAYALRDKSTLPYLFAGCTVTSQAQQLDFETCVFLCQQANTCVAMHHEDEACKLCRVNGNDVNSMTIDVLIEEGVDEHDQMHYFVFLEHLMNITIEVISDCEEVQSLLPNNQDAEYCMSLDGSATQGTRIYCHNLATSFPAAYLTLPAGSDENYSFTSHNRNLMPHGLIQYAKVGLDLRHMQINAWVATFATKNMTKEDGNKASNPYPAYGKAFGCPQFGNGRLSINLTGAGFYIPDVVTWKNRGRTVTKIFSIRTSQEVKAECFGDCCGCVPSSDGNNLFGTREEQVITVQYDPELDSTACIPIWAVVFKP